MSWRLCLGHSLPHETYDLPRYGTLWDRAHWRFDAVSTHIKQKPSLTHPPHVSSPHPPYLHHHHPTSPDSLPYPTPTPTPTQPQPQLPLSPSNPQKFFFQNTITAIHFLSDRFHCRLGGVRMVFSKGEDVECFVLLGLGFLLWRGGRDWRVGGWGLGRGGRGLAVGVGGLVLG